MAHRLNLARRPFVDTRPANLTAAFVLVLATVLTVVSVRTVVRYLDSSRRTREAISGLRSEIDQLEADRKTAEARLARFDVDALAGSTEDANQIALRRAFSWTRFLSRLETALPPDVRLTTVRLAPLSAGTARARAVRNVFGVDLVLISRDPEGLAKTVRAFYASPWFDHPSPKNEEIGERRPAEGRRLQLSVVYRDVEEAAP